MSSPSRKQRRASAWIRQHVGSQRRRAGYPGKIAHDDHESAMLHAREINRDPTRPPVCQPYWCRWGADPRDGPTAPVHWHVGSVHRGPRALDEPR